MNLSLIPQHVNGTTLLTLRGRITSGEESKLLRDTVRQLLAENHTRIVLHFKDVTLLDSCGVVTLLTCLASARAAGGDLKLAGVSGHLESVLQTARVLPLLEACARDEEALAAFR